MPIDSVTPTLSPEPSRRGQRRSSTARRSRSAIESADSASHSGSSTTNSSPA